MFSPQKQTEFELITLKDWPVRDAACHVEGLNLTLCCHVLSPCPSLGMHESFWRPRHQPRARRHLRPAATEQASGESRVLVSSSSHDVGPFLCLPVDKIVQISYS